MAKKPSKIRDPDLAEAMRAALGRGAFAPAEASRVIRALEGYSQRAFAAHLGVNVKAIRALESGSGNPRYDLLQKVARAGGLRVAFVPATATVELFDPDARVEDKRRRRLADAEALASGKVTSCALHDRYALTVDEITFELPSLA